MKSEDFVRGIAQKAEMTKKEAKEVLKAFVSVVTSALKEEGLVKVDELGTFKVKEREKIVRDIHRGISLGKRKFKAVSFKPVSSFKEAVKGES